MCLNAAAFPTNKIKMSDIGLEYYPARHLAVIRVKTGDSASPIIVRDFERLTLDWLATDPSVLAAHVEIRASAWVRPEILRFILPTFMKAAKRRVGSPIATLQFRIDGENQNLDSLNHRGIAVKNHHRIRLSKSQVKRWLPRHHINEDVLRRHIAENGVSMEGATVVPICPFPINEASAQVQKIFLLACCSAMAPGSKIKTVVLVPWREMTVLKLMEE